MSFNDIKLLPMRFLADIMKLILLNGYGSLQIQMSRKCSKCWLVRFLLPIIFYLNCSFCFQTGAHTWTPFRSRLYLYMHK